MRYILSASLIILAFIQFSTPFCFTCSCIILSSSQFIMCFGKTKTLKTLRNKCNNDTDIELGFNIDDRCDYIDPEQLKDTKFDKTSLNVIQLNCRGIKSTRKPYGFMQSSFWVIMVVHVMVSGD